MNKELREIKQSLKEMAQKEAYKLWRLARNAQRHGCSLDTVEKIKEEARLLHEELTAYPERLITLEIENRIKYAFK